MADGKPEMRRHPQVAPRLLRERDAAAMLGISASTLRTLGLRRRVLGSLRLYDIDDLHALADSLAYEGDDGGTTCAADAAFGSRD